MRKIIPIILSIVILGLVGTLDDAFAEQLTSFSSGDYQSASTWRNEDNMPQAPAPGDDKSIQNGHTVTLNGNDANSARISVFGTFIINALLKMRTKRLSIMLMVTSIMTVQSTTKVPLTMKMTSTTM